MRHLMQGLKYVEGKMNSSHKGIVLEITHASALSSSNNRYQFHPTFLGDHSIPISSTTQTKTLCTKLLPSNSIPNNNSPKLIP